ncbi:MAG: HAD family hydrolase, partial [Phycisphaerae bacterium]|nr:HAD family hydrolase [Phycisphaerae bacterium]
MECAVFLDRDNTLIANDGDLGDPDRVQLLRGVPDGLHALRQAGYRLIVVTNQGGVARGRFTEDDVDAVHQRIAALVDQATGQSDLINRFYYCPYHPKATLEDYRRDHPWRKPSPGMLLQAARDMNIDLGQSWMVGDQPRDMTAGRSAGCRTVYLGPATPPASETPPTVTAPDFPAAVQHILRVTPPRPAGSGS